MKTINVRLMTVAEADAVATLRAAGENVSQVIRESLLHRASLVRRPKKRMSAGELIAKLDALQTEHGEPLPDYLAVGVDTTDREQMSAYIRASVRRKRPVRGGKK